TQPLPSFPARRSSDLEDRHPHTNMAKAALNMLTHTSASGFAKDGIFMNAVDTGWVTDEDPAELSRIKTEIHDFQPPLDIVDGARSEEHTSELHSRFVL